MLYFEIFDLTNILIYSEATDNAVSAVGIVLEKMKGLDSNSSLMIGGLDASSMWFQWLEYLPLEHDRVRGHILTVYTLMRIFELKILFILTKIYMKLYRMRD